MQKLLLALTLFCSPLIAESPGQIDYQNRMALTSAVYSVQLNKHLTKGGAMEGYELQSSQILRSPGTGIGVFWDVQLVFANPVHTISCEVSVRVENQAVKLPHPNAPPNALVVIQTTPPLCR